MSDTNENWVDDTLKDIKNNVEKNTIKDFDKLMVEMKNSAMNCFEFYKESEMSEAEKLAWIQGLLPTQLYYLVPLWYYSWKKSKDIDGEKDS